MARKKQINIKPENVILREHFQRRMTKRFISSEMIDACINFGTKQLFYKTTTIGRRKVQEMKISSPFLTIICNPKSKQLITAFLDPEFEQEVIKLAKENKINMFRAVNMLFEAMYSNIKEVI